MVKYSYKYLEDEWTEGYWKFVCDNPDKNWKFDLISINPNITWDIIQDNPDKDWNWTLLSYNPNIGILHNNPDIDWCWGVIIQI